MKNKIVSPSEFKVTGVLVLTGMLLLACARSSQAATGTDTWTGGAGTANWSDAGNWSGVNTPPLLGDTPAFGTVGAGGATLNMDLVTPNTNFFGLTFNINAPSFVLNGGTVSSTGNLVDNSVNLETVNLNLIFDATHSLNAISGGTLQIGGAISGAGGVTKAGGGTVILTNANTYTGTTAVNAGTLKLDFSAAGAPAANIVRNTSVLSLGGGIYNVTGASSATSAQTNGNVTFASGSSTIAVVAGASGTAYLTLGTITRNNTGIIKVNVPTSGAVSTISGTASTVLVGGSGNAAYAYVTDSSGNVMDYAAKDSGNTFIGAGAANASGQYSSPAGTGNISVSGAFGTAIMDIVNGTGIRLGNSTTLGDGIRFNAPGAWFIDTASSGRLLSTTAFMVTSNVGPNNVTLSGAGGVRQPASGGDLIFMQDNPMGEFLITGGAMTTGSGSSATALVKAGRGTMNVSVAQFYTGQTYVNEGTLVINQNTSLGAAATGAQLNLNGGTLVGNATFTLDNAGANLRAVALGNNGGGLAAAGSFALTADGVIGGAAGTGPLTIGIPASALNGNVVGLVPGTGAGTPNTAINASGTVIVSGANTFFGGAVVQSGTLNINGINALGGANFGGLTLNGGTLQYSNTLTSGSDLSVGSGITLAAGGTIDLNGNTVTYANAIGNGGSGALTVASTAANGILTLSGANTFTGNTTISGGKLVLGGVASLASKNISVGSGATFDISALPYTVTAGKSLLGSGVVTGTVVAASGSSLIPGTLGTAGTLSFSNNLTLNTGETNYFDLSSSPAGSNDRIAVAGTLNLGGTKSVIAINFTGIPSAGRYKLFTFASKTGTAAANLTTNTFTGSGIGALTPSLDDSIPGEIDLVLTSGHVPTAITWLGDGVANIWDTTSLNWVSPDSKYHDSDFITFNDGGSASPAVNLTTALAPGSVLVNAVQNYTFSGPGQLGTGSLTKDNSGTLLILTTNTLPGPVAILGGTLQLGDGTASGTIGTGTVTNNAILVMDSPATVATGPVIGTGSTFINVGTLSIGGNSALNSLTLGASGTTGALDLAGSSATVSALALDPSATGGTIGNSSTTSDSLLSYIGGTSMYGGVIQDILGGGNKAVSLFVNSSGMLTLNSANPYSGGTVINSGTVALGASAATLGSGPVTLTNGSILSLWSGDTGSDPGASFPGNLANALIVPAGHNATIWNANRGTLSSSLTGSGTLGLRVNGVRGDVSGNWNAFNGQVNVTSRTGTSDDFRVALGGTTDNSYANLKMNLGPGVHMYQSVNPPSGSGTETRHNLGELTGDVASTLGGNPVGGRFADWAVGGLNTSVPFDGSIVDNTGATRINKVGTGNWTLTGASTHSGATWIVAGTLTVNGSFSASPLTNFNGGTLAGTGTLFSVDLETGSIVSPGLAGAGTLACSSDLTFNGGTNVVDLSSGGPNDLITVGGNLNLTAGAVRLVVSGTLANGTYPLITYGGALSGGAANLSLSGFSQPGQAARLSDTTPNEIDLVVETPAPKNLVWGGADAADNLWNVASSVNWSNGPGLTVFNNSDSVTFNDWAPGNTTLDVRAAVQASSVVVTGGQSYVFGTTTAGKISGATNSLTLAGTVSVELDMVNDYGGPTVIGSGTALTVGNGSVAASPGSGIITDNGTLVFNQTNNLSLTNVIGTGSLTANGLSTLTLAGSYTYTGNTTIGSGATLQAGVGNATGGLLGNVTDNGTLIMNQSGSLSLNSVISGAGVFIQNGSSVLTMNAVNTYQGNTFVNHGTLKLGASEVIPDAVAAPGSTGWFILDGNTTNAGIFDLNGFNESVNTLQGLGGTVLGDITNSAAAGTNTLAIGNALNGDTTGYAGLITENLTGAKIALVKQGTSVSVLTAANSYSGGTIVSGGWLTLGNGLAAGSGAISLSNGVVLGLQQAGSSSIFVGNDIITGPGMTATLTNAPAQLANAFTGSFFSGDANSTNVVIGNLSLSTSALKQLQPFAGTFLISAGAGVRFSASNLGTNGGDNTTFEVEGTLNTRNGTPNGPGVSLGALTGTGFLTGGGNAAGNGTYIVGAKGIDSTFAGTIQDSGNGNVAIVKTGPGTLTLNGTITYTGNTTVNDGTLALVEPVSLDNSPTINLGSGTAVIDVSGRSDTTLNLGNVKVQTLTGIGTINGNLNESANSFVRAGLGTLAVANTATFNGNLTLQLNRTNVNTHSEIAAASFVIACPLTVTNVGPALQGGDTFQLFSAGVSGFTVTNLPALTGSMYWTNTLLVNGTIAVINPVATNPTNLTFSVSGNTLSLSWPADHTGWTLQVQTNGLATGLATNWVDVAGSTSINSTNIIISPALPAAFYRLKL